MGDTLTLLGIPHDLTILDRVMGQYLNHSHTRKLQEDAEKNLVLEKKNQSDSNKLRKRRGQVGAKEEMRKLLQDLAEELKHSLTLHSFVLFWLDKDGSELQQAVNQAIMGHLQVFTVFDQKQDATISPHEGKPLIITSKPLGGS